MPETPVSRHACRVSTNVFAHLIGGGTLPQARKAQAAFVAWCKAHPELTDWRAAWKQYAAAHVATPAENAAHVPQTEHVGDPILPGVKGIQRIGRIAICGRPMANMTPTR